MKTGLLALALFALASAEGKEAIPLAGRDVAVPARVSGAAPAYPAMARDVGLQAMIVLQVTLSPEGRPTDIRVLRGVPLLDAAAIDAVKTWRYEPTTIDGTPRRVDVIEAVPFFGDAAGLADGLMRIASDRALPSHLRVEAVERLASAPEKSRKSVAKALQKLSGDADAAVSKSAATTLAAMGGDVK